MSPPPCSCTFSGRLGASADSPPSPSSNDTPHSLVAFELPSERKNPIWSIAIVQIWFLKNEEELGTAFSVPWTSLGIENLRLFPAAALKNAEIEIDFLMESNDAEIMGFRPMREATEADCKPSEDMKNLFTAREADEDGEVDMTPAKAREKKGEKGKAPLALILEPARELAAQVDEELTKFNKYLPPPFLRQLLLIGAGNPKAQKASLKSGLDIVAGTLKII
ncbi:ATP-dependent RNA helicase DDX1 [Gracilariopsis chorda]|uniref:ATP-dependent RNA helicase DDX1 n=1 Tax=Gracilariopsis chorda TaxID=448386 RepID=A0A2V3IL85_9FLOR|nr:ATP-dependent RNA helicase DDX1 [Gracilariopsis chorda]|eukprot:PXF42851.1 ATP-dependent RNA helicase DDX1 [Gracilariopsis chorda]